MLIYLLHHPAYMTFAGIACTWIFNNIVTVIVSSLPAPSDTSSARYVFWFKVLNKVVGNLQRAKSTSIENSPNWQPAVDKYIAEKYPHLEMENVRERIKSVDGNVTS